MSISEKLAEMTPKGRQYLVLGGAAATILVLAALSSSLLMDDQKPQMQPLPNEAQQTNIVTPGGAADPKEVWMEQSAAQMKQMNDMIKSLQGQIDEMQASAPTPTTSLSESPLPPLPPMPPQDPVAATQPAPQEQPTPVPAPAPKQPGIATFEVSQAAPEAEARRDDGMSYVPAGTFVRVALLGGLDAPTGGQAQSNPHPILMRAQDNAFLPNRYRFEIKECFLLGSSYGDISSERAIARLENLSCVREDGTAIDIPVRGYIVGEDGKAGMRGRLISKQGQVLANSLLAGVGSGIGQAFQTGATTQTISALGTTTLTSTGQQIQNGVGVGIGKALDRLSQYYINLAEKIFPVIEIDAGRTVEVVFTQGFSVEANKKEKPGAYTEIWQRAMDVVGDKMPFKDITDKALNQGEK